ncbi:MAG: response regulator, partial [Verrucomicrobia bacterium]|nr:response regulator [Verrucomicrobiota bacterium]
MDSPQSDANRSATPGRRIRTIVADDSPEFLRSFCSFLEAQDNLEIVGRAKNGAEAVRLAETLRPDLAVLDLEMPEMDGTRAAEVLREKIPGLRIIIVSVHDGPAWREMSRAAGVDAFVPKHQLTAELPNQIRALFGAGELPAAPPFVGSSLGTPHNLIDVLLVDDNEAHAAAVIRALTRPRVAGQAVAHFEVEHVATAEAAVELLRQNTVDAVLVGVRAAEAHTLQRIAPLRQAAALAAIIAVPDVADEHIAIAAGALGADECVCREHAELLPLALRFLVGGRRAEKSLAKREEDLRMLIENALDITCIVDGEFKIRYISPSARQVLGFNPEELRGRPCPALIHSDDVEAAQRTFAEARQHPQQTVSMEVRFHHHAGHWVHLEMTGRNLPDAG